MCGADLSKLFDVVVLLGLPPRVRSRLNFGTAAAGGVRITSACAEQTGLFHVKRKGNGDYLRVCGADPEEYRLTIKGMGLPPRVRSRPGHEGRHLAVHGITSACAEQTWRVHATIRLFWDYLRVCGADPPKFSPSENTGGLPPRVRSRCCVVGSVCAERGITSACAEQTLGTPLDCASA